MTQIPHYGAALPKEYKTKDVGTIETLGIKKLFRGIILSPSGGGKTNLVFHIIKNAPSTFSHLHIIARQPEQELYDYIKEKLAGFVTVYPPDAPPTLDLIKKDPTGGIQLCVIDDYSSDKYLQKQVFSHFFIRGRHKNLSTLFLTHSYFGTDKMIRLNSEYLWILKANSMRDLRLILSDFTIANLTIEKLIKAYEQATKAKGQALTIDNVRGVLRHNFEKEPMKIEYY